MRLTRITAKWSVMLIGVSVLLGWQFDIEVLKRPIPNSVAMNPTTALCFILSVIALPSDRESRWPMIATLAVLLIGLLKLFLWFIDMPFEIDALLFRKTLDADAHLGFVNRMAPNTTVAFILVGFALLVRRLPDRRGITELLAMLVLALGTLSIIGYVYHVPEFYGFFKAIPMAVHTAVGFLLLSLALLNSPGPGPFIMSISSNGPGGLMARWLLPLAVLMPVGMGALRLYGERQGIYSGTFGLMLHVVIIIVVFCYVIWRVATLVNEKDAQQKATEQQLEQLNEEL